MQVDRRDFLRGAGATFLATLSQRAMATALSTDAVYGTAFQKRDGTYGAAILSEDGELIYQVALPDRGHDISFDPVSKRSVVFARQPGNFMIVFSHEDKRLKPLTVPSISGRHFYGHGAFSQDGRLLYATENDFDNAKGIVGIYDTTDSFRRIGEFATHGVGPHELLLLPDGRTLAIANGGIETHPDFGRAELNLSTMQPNFVLVDRMTGDLIEKHVLPPDLHQLSIRHMAVDGAGSIWFGCQHRGPATETPLLVGRAQPGKAFGLIEMPDNIRAGFKNYIGSVAANPESGSVAVSSPQGNSYAILDARSGKVLRASTLQEVCGLAPDRKGFVASTGTGEIVTPEGDSHADPAIAWDNHMLRYEA